jgi:hypothetical protein
MPEQMSATSDDPVIKSLDDFLTTPLISRVTTESGVDLGFDGCTSRVCYQILHSTAVDILGGSSIKF